MNKNLLFSLSVTALLAFGSASANDCASATTLISSPLSNQVAISGSLAGATTSAPPQCAGPDGQANRWYKFDAKGSIAVVKAAGQGDLNIGLEVYVSCGGNLLACENSSAAGLAESATLTGLTIGSTYYFRVYHADATVNTNFGYTVSVSHVPIVQLLSSDCENFEYTTSDIIKSSQPQNTGGMSYFQWRFTELEAPFTVYEKISPNGINPNYRLQWFGQAEYGRNYSVDVRIAHAPGNLLGDYGPACNIGFQDDVLATQLQEQYANLTYRYCDVIGADPVGGADKYNWSLFDFSNTLLAQGSGNSRLLRIQDIPGVLLQRTYIVSVTATVNGDISPVGIQRTISTSSTVPPTRLRSDLTPCGSTVQLNSQLQAVEICKASSYTWRFQNTSVSQPNLIYTRVGSNRFIRLDWVAGLNVGNSYNVSVRATQGGKTGTYSTVCNITIGPDTSIPGLTPIDVQDDQALVSPTFSGMDIDLITNHSGNFSYQVFTGEDVNEPIRVALYDLNGRLVGQANESLVSGAGTYDWHQGTLSPGIYILHIQGHSAASSKKVAIF